MSTTNQLDDQTQQPPKELDRRLPRAARIIAFLESHGGYDGFVKLNDFLKTFYPLPKGREPALWTNQGEMRSLKHLLKSMKEAGEIIFSNTNYERLGDNYHTTPERLRRDYNISDLVIEARFPD